MANSKTIYIVRHAQGQHNVSDLNPDGNSQVKDPNLTPFGRTQCHALRAEFPHHNDVQIIMASGLRRTIQTVATSFAPVLTRPEVPFLLVPLAQEISDKPSDVGTDRNELESAMEDVLADVDAKFEYEGRIDYSLLEDGWNGKEGIYEASLTAVEKRAAALRSWLFKRPETTIVLVTHGAFIQFLTNDWTGLTPTRGTAWKTCEFRPFTFSDSSTEDDAHLVEIGGPGQKTSRPLGAHKDEIRGVEVVDTQTCYPQEENFA